MRKKQGIKEGTRLILFEEGDKIIIEKEEKISMLLKQKMSEEKGWQKLSEQSLKEVWDNKEDEITWRKYLKNA